MSGMRSGLHLQISEELVLKVVAVGHGCSRECYLLKR